MGSRGVGGVKVCVMDKLCQKVCKSTHRVITMSIEYMILRVYDVLVCVCVWCACK